MKRGFGVAVSACALALIALPASASALTKTVYAGGPPTVGKAFPRSLRKQLKADQPGINAFMQGKVTINAGDSVKFLLNGFHTIDLPGSTGKDLPFIVRTGQLVSAANDFKGIPFWFNGKRPALSINFALVSPQGGNSYDGSKRVDSGFFTGNGNPPPFTITFTKAGTYKYFCDVHPGMVGYVVVKATGKPIPSAKQDAATLKSEVTAQVKAAEKLFNSKQPKNYVSLGESDSLGLELYGMFPGTLKVKKGTVVKFQISPASREDHTATFGPTAYVTALGNALLGPPTPQTEEAVYPSSNPASGPIPENPGEHGNGFANTGILDRDPATPQPVSEKIDFTKAGKYEFICLIHPFMHGVIIVTR